MEQNGNKVLSGKVCLITGATSGHGFALACKMAKMGGEVIILGRDPLKCKETSLKIATASGTEPPLFLVCDLSSGSQIDRAVDEFLSWGKPLHILVNNAGIVTRYRQENDLGYELTFAVNYLSCFHLTLRLIDVMKKSAPARVVNISSDTHKIYPFDINDLHTLDNFNFMKAYGRSKHAIVCFTVELARRLNGTGVTINALDPGPVASGIASKNPGFIAVVADFLMKMFFPSPFKACESALYLASSHEVEGITGCYFKYKKCKKPRLASPEVIQKLWEISEAMTGVRMALRIS